jgi:hypothetical protein
MRAPKTILFVCIHSSARSQMAEAFVNTRYGKHLRAYRPGLEAGSLNPVVAAAMHEIGNLSQRKPLEARERTGHSLARLRRRRDGVRLETWSVPGAVIFPSGPPTRPQRPIRRKQSAPAGWLRREPWWRFSALPSFAEQVLWDCGRRENEWQNSGLVRGRHRRAGLATEDQR